MVMRVEWARLVLLVALFFVVAPSQAQEASPIATDRPGFGDGSAVMAPKALQVELGYAFSQVGDFDVHSLGQALVRYGLTNRLEARVLFNSYVLRRGLADDSGLEDLAVGVKIGLVAGDGEPMGRPHVAALVFTTLPTGSDGFGAESAQPEAKLALDWLLTPTLGLSVNAGYASLDNGEDRLGLVTLYGSISRGIASVAGLATFVGYRAQFADGDSNHDAETGLTYLLNPSTQLDVSAGVGLSENAQDFFIGFGIGKRF